MMAVSLYTSRVVLDALGVEDFGIYNVSGGVITLFSFVNGAMSSSTQRYITFELGKGNTSQLQKVFQTSMNVHLLVALLILFLGETAGLWFFYEKMVISSFTDGQRFLGISVFNLYYDDYGSECSL